MWQPFARFPSGDYSAAVGERIDRRVVRSVSRTIAVRSSRRGSKLESLGHPVGRIAVPGSWRNCGRPTAAVQRLN